MPLITESNVPFSRKIPCRMRTMLEHPLKNVTLLVTKILALVASKPDGPMTWSKM